MKLLRKTLAVIVVIFALFYLVTRPEAAATAVRGAFDALAGAFTSIITFFTALSK